MTTEISAQQLNDQQMKFMRAQEMDRDKTGPCDPPPEDPVDPPDTGGGMGAPDPHGGGGGGKD